MRTPGCAAARRSWRAGTCRRSIARAATTSSPTRPAVAAGCARRVRDVSEVLAEVGLPEPATRLTSETDPSRPLRVGYHDPCHLAHGQGVRQPPRALLKRVPGVELVDLPNSDWCCGSAGVYNLTHSEMANTQLQGKLD